MQMTRKPFFTYLMVRKGLFTWKVLGLEFTFYKGCPCLSSSISEEEEDMFGDLSEKGSI